MKRKFLLVAVWLVCACAAYARHDPVICGTNREKWREELHLHRRAVKTRAAAGLPAAQDAGNVAILDDSNGVVARRNDFNLDRQTLAFQPTVAGAARYRFQLTGNSYDSAAAASGTGITGLGDDDTRELALPFSFPFFAASYQRVFVNSDGNLTFVSGDKSSGDRSLGAMTAGPPRIGGLYEDLDPSKVPNSVRVLAESGRFVVTWVNVPEYSDFGIGAAQTFQARLFPDGRIEFAYQGIFSGGAVVGISPGGLQGSPSVVSFFSGNSQEYSSTVAERFGGNTEIDVVTAAQRFYQTHEDAYDYVAFFNNLGIASGSNSVSYEITVRNQNRSGYGDDPIDVGQEFGSARRLQAVLNLGPLNQYPDDPNGFVTLRPTTHDTPVTIIAHEAGHLFLAYASVRDPQDPAARPMLGFQNAHWTFAFDSEASLLEGNRIQDNGAGVSPRFLTTGVTQAYSPLDQYLMGFRAPEEVPGVFLVTSPSVFTLNRQPQLGVSFDGGRRDIQTPEIILAEGRRTPDYTVSQRRFRFAFVLIVAAGTTPSTTDLAKVDTFRQHFEDYYQTATSNRSVAETTLQRSLRLSTFPAAGVVLGSSISGSVALEKPASQPLTVQLTSQSGVISVPKSVTIAAGATSASFPIAGLQPGVDELIAQPSDPVQFETPHAHIQVAASPASLHVKVLSGDQQVGTAGSPLANAVVFRVTDINDLPYPGVRVQAVPSTGGSVTPTATVTDDAGAVSFRWTPGPGTQNKLTATLDGTPPVSTTATAVAVAGRPLFSPLAVQNAASFQPGIAPGSLVTIFGANLSDGTTVKASYPWPDNLANTQVLFNGTAATLVYVSPTQINLYLPPGVQTGPADVVVINPAGASATVSVPVLAAAPGIFFDPVSGIGAAVVFRTGQLTSTTPAVAGDYLEIFCTGLGSAQPQVSVGGVQAPVTFSGLAPGFVGLNQVNAQVPSGAPGGLQYLSITANGMASNNVGIRLQ